MMIDIVPLKKRLLRIDNVDLEFRVKLYSMLLGNCCPIMRYFLSRS